MRRLWRRLTCGRGRHRWQLQAGLDLAWAAGVMGYPVVVTRSCPRCGLVEVLE